MQRTEPNQSITRFLGRAWSDRKPVFLSEIFRAFLNHELPVRNWAALVFVFIFASVFYE